MCLFALYVGMIRSTILRKGVLFFIRSQDDPNIRLIHDALVKPLSLQMSRFMLSAVLYTLFIIFGIGGLTYGVKYFSSIQFFPIEIPSSLYFYVGNPLPFAFTRFVPLLIKYVRLYWCFIFKFISHQLRLSSFLLNNDDATERGYIVYKNIFQRLLKAKPDYSKPESYQSAMIKFKEDTSINAIFIPNGNFVRAPNNDSVKRKFLDELFIPVTKEDVVL
ncbi:E3 ubiquitin-protein ligase SSM4 ASCRUDRAFT_16481, partial [Ascoidea rubescens DSM 1968]